MALILPFKGITPKLAEDVFIAETAVVIGDVEIGSGSSVWYGCVVRGDVNRIRVGRNTNLQDGTIVHCNDPREGDYREIGIWRCFTAARWRKAPSSACARWCSTGPWWKAAPWSPPARW
jgi:hypothetical protein